MYAFQKINNTKKITKQFSFAKTLNNNKIKNFISKLS